MATDIDVLLEAAGGTDQVMAEIRKRRALLALQKVRDVLSKFTFAGYNEEQIQRQVLLSLGMAKSFGEDAIEVLGSEVVVDGGRFDILVDVTVGKAVIRIVLELKVKGTAAAAERQSQRYAQADGIDAVALLTTSSKLARDLAIGQEAAVHQTLGGKPFGVIYLRPF